MEPSQKLIEELFEKGILVSKDFFEKSSSTSLFSSSSHSSSDSTSDNLELTEKLLDKITVESDLVVLSSDYVDVLKQSNSLVDWYEIDKYRVDAEKDRDDELYQTQLQSFKTSSLTVDPSITNSSISNSPVSSNLSNFPDFYKSSNSSNSLSHISGTSHIEERISSQQVKSLEVTLDNPNSSSFKTTSPFLDALHATNLTSSEVDSLKSSISNFSSSNISSNNLSIPSSDSLLPISPITPVVSLSSPLQQTINIIISYKNKPKKYTVQDFTRFFLTRYTFLEGILRNRQELQQLTTINRVLQKKEKEQVSIIGLVEEIGETKNGNLVITLEDKTGKIKVIISKSKKELYVAAKDVVPDEVIGILGTSADKIIFGENIVWPDIPPDHEMKKSDDEEYVIFLSDVHVGSNFFLKDEFNRFLRWLNGNTGNESQRDVAKKVKYIIIAGDLVDGVGIYPSQEDELEIKTIEGQYAEFTRLIQQIPQDKQIIMCPGNHDMVYLAEPQPVFYQQFAPGLFNLPNVTLVTNPAIVNVGKKEKFSGFDILLYHGYSFDYYVANVESIRTQGGYHRADLIMKFMLKRRHLAPSFKSTPYFPAHDEDPLLIKKIPDFFITGHIHYSCVANYKGITMISGSCWQGKTTFQEKLGHQPEPARVPIVNLKTREVKVLRFG